MSLMEDEEFKKRIFREINERKRMEKVYKNLSPSTSFEDLKKHSGKSSKRLLPGCVKKRENEKRRRNKKIKMKETLRVLREQEQG